MAIVLTTGVLVKDPDTFNAHVEVVNLSNHDRTVTVEFLDWDVDQLSGPPVPIPGFPSGPVIIPPNTHVAFLANTVQSTAQPALLLSHYEIRITLSNDDGVIANCFAIDANTKIIEGNTVRHHELIPI